MQSGEGELRKRNAVDALLKEASERLREQNHIAGSDDVGSVPAAKAAPVLRLVASARNKVGR